MGRRRRERDLTGKVAVVTGAGSGIGRATAALLARLGAKVHVVELSPERAEAVAGEIRSAGGEAVAHVVDVSDSAAVEGLAARVFAEDGAVDVLHNNAGIGHAGPVEETPLEEWERVLAVNLMGTVYGVHSFVPRMLAQGRPAHIVNTASGAGLVANAQMAPYCTSKFGVVGLSETLNAELSSRGIHVTALCPGTIDTPIVEATYLHGAFADNAEGVRRFFRKRGAPPEAVAEAVMRAIERRRVIQTVPRMHVDPVWILKRISPRASQRVSRLVPRFAALADRLAGR